VQNPNTFEVQAGDPEVGDTYDGAIMLEQAGCSKWAWLLRGFGLAGLMLAGISACVLFPSPSPTASQSGSAFAFNPAIPAVRGVNIAERPQAQGMFGQGRMPSAVQMHARSPMDRTAFMPGVPQINQGISASSSPLRRSAPPAMVMSVPMMPQIDRPVEMPYDPLQQPEQPQQPNASYHTLGWLSLLAVSAGASFMAGKKSRRILMQEVIPQEGIPHAADVNRLFESLQHYFVDQLERVHIPNDPWGGARLRVDPTALIRSSEFLPVPWLRANGQYGGGKRYEVERTEIFNRASVNVSAVNYEEKPESPVDSANALSVIIHPHNPHAPSMHFHISRTQPRNGAGYWRMIADLNPSIPYAEDKAEFDASLQKVVPAKLYKEAVDFGDRYFHIPPLEKYRGISHMFIAKLDDKDMDTRDALKFAQELAKSTIDTYTSIVQKEMDAHPASEVTDEDWAKQLEYHSLYFYQVLTLDRGTTAGLLSNSDNDVGCLGSLPSAVSRELLLSWMDKTASPQKELLGGLIDTLPAESPAPLRAETRAALAEQVRTYYATDRKAKVEKQAEMNLERWTERTQNILT
jgi:coproporphyrinogen III oxidase